MSVLGGVPHNGKGPASPTAGQLSWEEWCEEWGESMVRSEAKHFSGARGTSGHQSPEGSINPSHYVGHNGIECHAVQRAVLGQAGMGAYWHGCALKYVFRALRKNGSEDIKKAIRCLQFWLDEVTPDESQREKLS